MYLFDSFDILLVSLLFCPFELLQPQSADCYQFQYDSGSEVNWGNRGNLT